MQSLFKKLDNDIKDKVECVNMAIYNKIGKFRINCDGANSKVLTSVPIETAKSLEINATTIDTFFKDIPFSFIKSDIEGAEMPALMGGRESFKKYRPIFAFSIYHSISDYWGIPCFLNSLLQNYTFYIRNHYLFCAEIVLYAIPNERM